MQQMRHKKTARGRLEINRTWMQQPLELNVGHVTDKELAKANIDHHLRGWCSFEGLVLPGTRRDMLSEAKSSHFVTIFNRLGHNKSAMDSRSAAKAGARGEQVLADIVSILRRGLIIGDEHVVGLGRGATYLQTPPKCVQQSTHVDFDFVTLRRPGRRCVPRCQPPYGSLNYFLFLYFSYFWINASKCREVPVSVWVALQDCSLYFEGAKHQFKAGDVVVFAGDMRHAGAECDSATEATYRLFAYLPTRNIPVPWQVKDGMADLATPFRVADPKVAKELHETTYPCSQRFDMGSFRSHLYDPVTNTFYRFDMQLWLSGLTTQTTSKCSYATYVDGAPPLIPHHKVGKCPHFDPHDFNATKHEKTVLCDFRRQCKTGIYCQGTRTLKRLRTEDEL